MILLLAISPPSDSSCVSFATRALPTNEVGLSTKTCMPTQAVGFQATVFDLDLGLDRRANLPQPEKASNTFATTLDHGRGAARDHVCEMRPTKGGR